MSGSAYPFSRIPIFIFLLASIGFKYMKELTSTLISYEEAKFQYTVLDEDSLPVMRHRG